MNKRAFLTVLAVCSVVLAGGVSCGLSTSPTNSDAVKVVVTGSLGTILRHENTQRVTATIQAGGGEFVIDVSDSTKAREAVLRLADKYIKQNSSAFVSPLLLVTGRLECRPTQMVADNGELTEGPKTWVLVADSVVEAKDPGK